jgi:hypothetical protein
MNVAKPITPTGSTSVTSMTEQPYHANSGILSHSRLWSQSSELAVFIGLARSNRQKTINYLSVSYLDSGKASLDLKVLACCLIHHRHHGSPKT